MKDVKEYEKDLASIRNIMERTAKFISLSGLSGVLAGVYALAGATAAYFIVQYPVSPFDYRVFSVSAPDTLWKLIGIAAIVLILSVGTGLLLSNKKAVRHGLKFWGGPTKKLIINQMIPLTTGRLFILIMLGSGHYGLAAPASLIFYGLALINASSNTFDEIRYLRSEERRVGKEGR